MLERNRISGFVLLSYVYGSGSRSCSFRQRLSRCQPKKRFFSKFFCLLKRGIYSYVCETTDVKDEG
jgi:hypothetical protein